ncbi:hypothetical protein P7L53_00795 [Thermoleptolyngbya sichuanensis XZ-Cy5]|uniref:outer membrane protein n=1 Tax=Thermoleptolyngbya sichuanensis TaxID=2885951 RepID=UPI00240CF947|nr:hypothetical protein [Thermoleptolyngbya sichuanensis]MDG2614769.1 hypothetical protein [Thermoleptolyngbya sichuanensis XZ-Cy5]
MLRQSALSQGYWSQHFSQTGRLEECRSFGMHMRAIAQTLSIAASVAAVVWVAPAQATEPRPSAPELTKSIHWDTQKSPALAVVSEDASLGELRETSKFSSITLHPDSIPPASPQPEPTTIADLPIQQIQRETPAWPPALEPQPQPTAQLLLDELPAEEPIVEEFSLNASSLAQASLDLLDESSEPALEPVDLPEPADLPEGEFSSESVLFDSEVQLADSAGSGGSRLGSRWQVTVEPYFFIPLDVRADIAAVGRSTTIRADLDNFLDLDRAFDGGLRVDAQNGRFGILLDGFYLSLAQSGTLPVTFPAGSLLGFGIPFEVEGRADASASLRQGKIDLAAYYRVVNQSLRRSPTPTNPFPFLVVDPILGLRTNISRQEIEVDEVRIGPNTIPINREFSSSRTTLEPLVGLRVGLQLSPRWSLGLESTVSGFNINAERDTTFNFQAGVGYSFSRSFALFVDYVYKSYEFRDGSGLRRSEINLDQHGLNLRLSIRF